MKCPDGSYELVSGNEVGVLLLDYICAGRNNGNQSRTVQRRINQLKSGRLTDTRPHTAGLNRIIQSLFTILAHISKINSDVFARTAACVLAANGIKVRIYDALMPVPALSFATRFYGANAGIMVTASHNPAKYNRTLRALMAS